LDARQVSQRVKQKDERHRREGALPRIDDVKVQLLVPRSSDSEEEPPAPPKVHQQSGNALPYMAPKKASYLCLDAAPDHLSSQYSRAVQKAEASHEVLDLVALAVRIPAWQSLEVLPLNTLVLLVGAFSSRVERAEGACLVPKSCGMGAGTRQPMAVRGLMRR
jgi:hypothetical protein